MQPIRVVHVANIDVGLKVHLGNYMRYQRAQGYDVSAVTHPGSWITYDQTILDGVSVKVMPFQPQLSPVADIRTLGRLVRYFRQQRFDIVHTHTVKPGLLGRLAARLARVPVILHTVHGFYFYEGMSPAQVRFYVGVEKVGAACGDLLLSQNRQDMEAAVQRGICPPEKIVYLGNGIDLARFDPRRIPPARQDALRAELGLPEELPVIGYVARLEEDKGINEFLGAARLLADRGLEARHLVIGSYHPGKKTAVEPAAAIRNLGLEDRVLHLGYRDDVPELVSLMSAVVLPSHGREGVPRILMESAALARPVVATRVRGVLEAVEDGVTGILVPPRDAAALAGALQELLGDPARLNAMGRAARRKALADFDERTFFYRTDAIYRRLLQAKLGAALVDDLAPMPMMEAEF